MLHTRLPFVMASVALAMLVSAVRADEPKPPEGFTALFNGKDLKGWHGRQGDLNPQTLAATPGNEALLLGIRWMEEANQHWRVENGELVNDGKGPFLTTNKDFRDFELRVDWKILAKGDSGVYLKAYPQVQIWDYTKEAGYGRLGADKGSGGLWNNSPGAPGKDPLVLADNPPGQWNTFRIIQIGERTTVYLNDKLVVKNARMENIYNRKLPLMVKGPIQLQKHDHETRWRNIYVREIPTSEANNYLRDMDKGEGFETVFNGKDFTGWGGPVENYEIKDGAIQCKPSKGGTIYTKEEYGDFVARLEFKLPPRGNNGLAIRYPGEGDTAYVGMCELQVLDDAYKGIDSRQAHGSAYGMVAAHRGYQRPIGEWNYQEVTVKGSTIKVELNGTLILDCDLSKVTEFMGNRPHPGKDRTSGHFGFAGHNDPVAFRNIQIKRLDQK